MKLDVVLATLGGHQHRIPARRILFASRLQHLPIRGSCLDESRVIRSANPRRHSYHGPPDGGNHAHTPATVVRTHALHSVFQSNREVILQWQSYACTCRCKALHIHAAARQISTASLGAKTCNAVRATERCPEDMETYASRRSHDELRRTLAKKSS